MYWNIAFVHKIYIVKHQNWNIYTVSLVFEVPYSHLVSTRGFINSLVQYIIFFWLFYVLQF